MKLRILALASALIGAAHTASAEKIRIGVELEKDYFYYGARAGLNLSNVTKTSYASSRLRFNAGAMLGYQFNSVWAIQGEVLYSAQGNDFRNNDDMKVSLNYLKVPILGKLFLYNGLNLEAGLSFNFLVRAVEIDKSSGTKVTTKLNDKTRGFDLAIPVGLNYRFDRTFDVGIRYDISLLRIADESQNKARNSNWSFSLGVRF